MTSRRAALTAALVAAGVGLSACGSSEPTPAANATEGAGQGGKLAVVASFYPLAYAVEQVGGDKVEVTNLTKAGVEPHDLELTPQDVATVTEAKLAVYEKGFQPAVDKAITDQEATAFDVSTVADLSLRYTDAVGGDSADHSDHSDHDDHSGHSHEEPTPATQEAKETQAGDHAGHDHATEAGTTDPHFWLDPIRYQKVAQAIATELGRIDPINKGAYYENATAFSKELTTLDGDFAAALRTCKSKKLVTSHAAFAYLADRFGLQQVAISGLSPEAEPDPARLAAIADYVKANKIATIYTETLANPALGETLAKETGAKTAVLDPLEGLNDESAGADYLSVMRTNLATLQKGQQCT